MTSVHSCQPHVPYPMAMSLLLTEPWPSGTGKVSSTTPYIRGVCNMVAESYRPGPRARMRASVAICCPYGQ